MQDRCEHEEQEDHPSQHNKPLHREARKDMSWVQRQAIQRWKEELKTEFSCQSLSSKEWWSRVK